MTDRFDKNVESFTAPSAARRIVELERMLAERLARPLPGPRAQQRFAPRPWRPDWAPDLTPDTGRRAAALVLLYPAERDVRIPLTLRHAGLPHHAGQVSLPGGALEAGEAPHAAALREAEEEIGLRADRVRILGALSTLWVAVSNFIIHPFVGIASELPEFRVHPREVDALVTVPLDRLLDRDCLTWTSPVRLGHDVRYPGFAVGSHLVWGATAMILGEFACLFDPDHAPAAPG
jgi:8-oxo-dGTP pyrophosphatase MutT (NUDIX family)